MKKIFLLFFGLSLLSLQCTKKSARETLTSTDSKIARQAGIPQVDNAVSTFMQRYQVPGMSVAITRQGKLVYAKSYGMAIKESSTPVTNNSLFRIASLSKAITSVAILKLAEAGKLTLDSKVFGTGALLGTQYGTLAYSTRLKSVTVRHLLQHTAGGWQNDGSDPMFSNPGMTAAQLISWTLDNRPLAYTPGTQYAYSNFGYCVLARVIEKLSGLPYDQYVKNTVLQPSGISSMQIGGNTLADRKPNEVKYYGQNGEDSYCCNVTRMDGHGGWIASATDLARLLVKVDGIATKPDLLTPASITAMTTPSAANANYALGWAVNIYNNWWHTGSLPGTGTEMVRAGNGFNWVLLCNTRTGGNFTADLDNLIWIAVNDPATVWPNVDLF